MNPTPQHPEGNFTIVFSDVTRRFVDENGRSSGVLDLTATVPHGKITTIVGPSGSGKSTLLSLCNLLLVPDSGQVFVHGREIREWAPDQLRRSVGLVFQNPTMFPGTVSDNLAIAPRLQGLQPNPAEYWLERVGLPTDLKNRTALDLSGGQKQRLSLARTLSNHPRVLLLDEVTSALDPAAAKEIEELVLSIHREQEATILWVTHNLEQAERVSHYTWLMADGHLIENGLTSEFFAASKTEAGRRFLHGELTGRSQV